MIGMPAECGATKRGSDDKFLQINTSILEPRRDPTVIRAEYLLSFPKLISRSTNDIDIEYFNVRRIKEERFRSHINKYKIDYVIMYLCRLKMLSIFPFHSY